GVEFEWDENKARSNLKKHGVKFEEATEVFFNEARSQLVNILLVYYT
ncbi:MAG: BrnT family toxin, partial [Nostoc sp.]